MRIEIDGEAASAASLIAFAGDSLYMAAGAQIMMHEPYFVFFFMMADKRVLLRLANRLEATVTELRRHLRRCDFADREPRRAR